VSSLGDRTTTRNGATVYTIGTRNASTLLRLKDGEMQILAGLIQDEERKNASKLPALGDIPILGRLFSNQEDRKNKTEIVLAITPRILGNIRRPDAEISEYWSGTENGISDKPQLAAPAGSGSPAASGPAVESTSEAVAADATGVSSEDAAIAQPGAAAANTSQPAPTAPVNAVPAPAAQPAVEGVELSR